jgi:hypothetical protein
MTAFLHYDTAHLEYGWVRELGGANGKTMTNFSFDREGVS